MKKLLLTIFFLLLTSPSWATVTTVAIGATKDTYLSAATGSTQTNYDTQDLQVRSSSTSTNDRVSLISFDLTGIPAGSYIWGVYLKLTFSADVPGSATIGVYKNLRETWVENEATWEKYKTTSGLWTTQGGRGDGTDGTETDMFGQWETGYGALAVRAVTTNDDTNESMYFTTTTPLREYLQASIGSTAHFIIHEYSENEDLVKFYDSEEATPAYKPELTIAYSNSSQEGMYKTFYVRTDGGSRTRCNGLYDAADPGSGSYRDCAFNHLYQIFPPNGTDTLYAPVSTNVNFVGGDRVIVKDGTYEHNFNGQNSTQYSSCYSGGARYCFMSSFPSGPNSDHKTRIYGEGWNTGCSTSPILLARHRVESIISLAGHDNIEINCFELTDADDCLNDSFTVSSDECGLTLPYSSQNWGQRGITALGSENVILRNLNIHGLGDRGVWAGKIDDWLIENVDIRGNKVGWDGDTGTYPTTAGDTGTITFNHVNVEYSGCVEEYPIVGDIEYRNCIGGNHYADGFGTDRTAANYTVLDSSFSFNTHDGFDALYNHGVGTITVKRSKFINNGGNQVKFSGASNYLEDSIIGGSCCFLGTTEPYDCNEIPDCDTGGGGTPTCRAGGNAIAFSSWNGTEPLYLINNTIAGTGTSLLEITYPAGSPSSWCSTKTENVYSYNNLFLAGQKCTTTDPYYSTTLYYKGIVGGGDCADAYSRLSGESSFSYHARYIKDFTGITQTQTNPNLTNISWGGVNNNTLTYNDSINFVEDGDLDLTVNSTDLIGTGSSATAISLGADTVDYRNFQRGGSWDVGGLEYGGTSQTCTNSCSLCTSEYNCETVGPQPCYWDRLTSACSTTPSCDDDCTQCSTEDYCTGSYRQGGCFWWGTTSECKSTQSTNCNDICSYCTNQSECESATADCVWSMARYPEYDECFPKVNSCYDTCSLCDGGNQCENAEHTPGLTCFSWLPEGSCCRVCHDIDEFGYGAACAIPGFCNACVTKEDCLQPSMTFFDGVTTTSYEHNCHWDKKKELCSEGSNRTIFSSVGFNGISWGN